MYVMDTLCIIHRCIPWIDNSCGCSLCSWFGLYHDCDSWSITEVEYQKTKKHQLILMIKI